MTASWITSKKMNWFYRFILGSVWCFFKIFYRHRVYGLEHFCDGGAIIACNHTSFYDPPVVAISAPEELHFLAREGLFKNPLFGALIRKLNSHPVSGDASDIAVLKLTCQLLNEGKKIILFPEGRRAFSDQMQPLKAGVAMLISRSKAFVIPTYVHGTYGIWSRKRKLPKLWGKTACVFGSPIRWEEFAALEKREAQAALTQKLAESIQALRRWYEAGTQGLPP